MPTASDPASSQQVFQPPERKSVFGNYSRQGSSPAAAEAHGEKEESTIPSTPALGLARSFIYRFLARVFEYPDAAGWDWMSSRETEQALESSVQVLNEGGTEKISLFGLEQALQALHPDSYQPFLDSYIAAFGHAARGSCPLNEIEYGELKADPLFQPHRLADIAAFYRAHGLEVTADATERQDHICMELEFMSVLAAKEAYARHKGTEQNEVVICQETQKRFLREHLARWTPAFFRRVVRHCNGTPLAAFAELAHAFLLNDCARFGVPPGSQDLVLRAIDKSSESLCGSCGLHANLPGAKA